MTRIHVETGATVRLSENSLISKLAWHWSKAGYEIGVGPVGEIPDDADLAILHVDRTFVDPASLPLNPRRVPFLNGRVLDISKRSLSTLRVSPCDSWKGEVIVKSNFNFFGFAESAAQHSSLSRRLRQRLSRSYWTLAGMLPSGDYPVLPNLTDVPTWVWKNPDLIVERFLPERENGLYCVRGWVFFGSRGYTYRAWSPKPLVKANTITGYELLGDPPVDLVDYRQAHGWDFGKFDFVMVDGRPVLLDANKTPSVTANADPDTPRLRDLASGLDDFVRQR